MKQFLLVIVSLGCLLINSASCFKGNNIQDEQTPQAMQSIIELVENNKISEVEQALKAGAKVNTIDQKKQSLLLIATRAASVEMARLLVKYGADVNQQDEIQDSPFLFAGASGQTNLVELFLAHGANFRIFNRYNGTALIPACERGHVETVRVLANTKGFPVDHVNRLGWTALMEAVVLGNGTEPYQKIVSILKAAGANLSIPDKQGITALQHARSSGYTEIVRVLESR